jgi:hypothetical protein
MVWFFCFVYHKFFRVGLGRFWLTAAICDEAVALLSKIKGKFENKKEIGCHSLVRAVGEGRERKWACYTLATRPIRGEAFNGAEIQCTP